MKRLLDLLDVIGKWIDSCVTRKCWMCNGTGETLLYGIEVECDECKGAKKL